MLRDKMIQRLKDKRGESKMSPEYMDAKRSTLRNLSHEMSGMAAEPLKNLKQVSVAGDSPEAIQHGLEVAKGVVDQLPEGSDSEESAETPSEEASEEPAEQMSEEHSGIQGELQQHEMSEEQKLEDINRKLDELLALKNQMMSGRLA